MIRKATITIPEPCHEDWNKMTVAEKGRFCASCQKHVYDFTKFSDREILKQFNNEPNLCGRFSDKQLNRELVIPKEKSTFWIAAASGVLTLINPGNTVYSQQQATETVENQRQTPKITQPADSQPVKISGTISDPTGTLPGVNVVIKGTTRGVQTDIDGNFEIMAARGETLVISFVGLREQEIIVDQPVYNIMMDSRDVELQGGPILVRKRSIFGRFLVWTANLFRKDDNKRCVKYH
jgi:hypothetical protein